MSQNSIKGELAKQAVIDFPDVPHRQLARMLLRDNPSVFSDFEDARGTVRYHAGTYGTKHRATLSDKSLIRPKEKGAQMSNNPFGLPKEQNDHWKPMRFPIRKGKGMALYDTHIPYHDIRAITMSLEWGIGRGYTDFIFLGGDMLDCYQLSRFERDPRKREFVKDLDDFKKFLDGLRNAMPSAVLIWHLGNHELWLEKYLKAKAPELLGLKEFIWREYLELDKRGVILIEDDIPLTIGKLNIIHGHELKGSNSPVNPARGAYLKAAECILEGHWHRTSMHAESSFSRRLDTAWSVGCLCNLSPEYARINKWNHGCCGIEIDGNDFDIKNKRIIEANKKWIVR